MKILTLDQNFQAWEVVDNYESFIWTDRYNQPGDFELYLPASDNNLDKYVQGNYLWFDESERLMIIEKIEIQTDIEDGDHIIVTGRSLEVILERRIVWGHKSFNGKLQDAIKTLLNESIISPSIADRKIDGFVFKESDDPRITDLTIDAQYTGDNLLDVILGLCETNDLGFKVTHNDDGQFIFELFIGEDRSFNQVKNDYVIFSPKFNNLINSDYQNTEETLRNVALVGGEEKDNNRTYETSGSGSGINRREMFVNATDIKKEWTDENGNRQSISDTEYHKQLIQRGDEELKLNQSTKLFDAEVETSKLFIYGEDYFMGDILQITNAYGIEKRTRVTEMIHSYDTSGYSKYPTFTIIEDEET